VVWTHGAEVRRGAAQVLGDLDVGFWHQFLSTDPPDAATPGRQPDRVLAWWRALAHELRDRGLEAEHLALPARVRRADCDEEISVIAYASDADVAARVAGTAAQACERVAMVLGRSLRLSVVRARGGATEQGLAPTPGSGPGEGMVARHVVSLEDALRDLPRYRTAFAWDYTAVQAFAAGVPVYAAGGDGEGRGPLDRHRLAVDLSLFPCRSEGGLGPEPAEWLGAAIRLDERTREVQRLEAETMFSPEACAERLLSGAAA
jgi:hypothetical protein